MACIYPIRYDINIYWLGLKHYYDSSWGLSGIRSLFFSIGDSLWSCIFTLFSQFFTIFHNFSQIFTFSHIFSQTSHVFTKNGEKFVKICEKLWKIVKNCEKLWNILFFSHFFTFFHNFFTIFHNFSQNFTKLHIFSHFTKLWKKNHHWRRMDIRIYWWTFEYIKL